MSKRLDLALVDLKLATSRTQAQELILSGAIEIFHGGQWLRVTKPSHKVIGEELASLIKKSPNSIEKYVSRGGLKLEGALSEIKLSPKNSICLDLGQSTGGFTDCLLKAGAKQVVGVDVGHGQLAESLKAHPQNYYLEGINVRELRKFRNKHAELQQPFDLIVGDLSFISLSLIIPELPEFLTSAGQLLLLVKPQFELNSDRLNKNGVVKDINDFKLVEEKISKVCTDAGLKILNYFNSSIEGKDGNKEFFIHGSRN